MQQISVKKSKIEKEKGVVILPLGEYKKLLEQAIPTYYLTGKAAREVDELAEEGLKEYHEGKTIKAKSLTEALKIYERRNKR